MTTHPQMLMTEAEDLDLSDPMNPEADSPNALMEPGFEISKVSAGALYTSAKRAAADHLRYELCSASSLPL